MEMAESEKKEIKIEPYMMMVLSKRLEAIAREMTNTTLRAARSGVMNLARDFSPAYRGVCTLACNARVWGSMWRRTGS